MLLQIPEIRDYIGDLEFHTQFGYKQAVEFEEDDQEQVGRLKRGRFDMLIIAKDFSFAIVIEVKVEADFHFNQIEDYRWELSQSDLFKRIPENRRWIVTITKISQKPALAVSNIRWSQVQELLASTEILFVTPMWNFTLPAMLKSYFDQIVRIGRTFSATYEGLAAGRKVWVIRASGSGYESGSPTAGMNEFDGPMKTILKSIGLTDVTIYAAEHTNHIDHGKFTLDAYTTQHAPRSVIAAEVARAKTSMDAYINEHALKVVALLA